MTQTALGKISHVSFGLDHDGRFGLNPTFSTTIGSICEFRGMWSEHDKYCKWTKDDQIRHFGVMCMDIIDVLKKAKKREVMDLVNLPVEVIFDGNSLKSWRVLEEVL